MSTKIKAPKKLIEVALPLDDINRAAGREKSIRHGHPSTLHLWWARRPLAAARAVLFAQLVNDPGGERGYFAGRTKAQADEKREELFNIMRDLILWESTNKESVLARARAAIRESWLETCEINKSVESFDPETLPSFYDPFAGGGAIPMEAQRLGLKSGASDLNPVAVMINKSMIEFPAKFANLSPVGPIPEDEIQVTINETWIGTQGLAEDIRRYGSWVRGEAAKRVGHLYPEVIITEEIANDRRELKPFIGKSLMPIAWLWAHTVKSPNPAYSHVDVPLISNFILSKRNGNYVWLDPVVSNDTYHFDVRTGTPPEDAKNGTKLARGANFRCIVSNTPIDPEYIYSKAKSEGFKQRLIAVVVSANRKRIYLPAYSCEKIIVKDCGEVDHLTEKIPNNPRWFSPPMYGLETYANLFTSRQLKTLSVFTELINEVQKNIELDAKGNMHSLSFNEPEKDYGKAVATYLSFGVNKMIDYNATLVSWSNSRDQASHVFSKQALPMVWDFAEVNPFANAAGDYAVSLKGIIKSLLKMPVNEQGFARQENACSANFEDCIVSTDPPYYDNIGYADLSDYFYVWMRKNLQSSYPDLFTTLAVPKADELVATPYRHGGKKNAEIFFLQGMTDALRNLCKQAHKAFPVTIYYAFKQSETKRGATASTGWETFLEAVLSAGFSITGTWPMRTEREVRSISQGTNALASSIVLVCRRRPDFADTISRRQFQRELREQMPIALDTMVGGAIGQSPIAPVDLAQAAIGPGMAVFSKYSAVLTQDGSPMSVHDALILINREITEYLNPDAGNFDADTLFCAAWFDQFGWKTGTFGDADTLARAKGTVVEGVRDAGVIRAEAGEVQLLKWADYPEDWNPGTDKRLPVWEACHHIIRVLNTRGEIEAGKLLAMMPERGETIRQLAYHLYTLCERRKWAEDARAYNELITSWHAIVTTSQDSESGPQMELDLGLE
ncbi:MAG: DUF1156 domain-containing protein [Acidobacteriota bacterium]|nr:DUF1156 domain-containing protein [Acidobacteriota bacterium]